MAKFKAAEAVETLEYDFEGFGNGAKGVIQEPTTGLVNGFFKNMKAMMRDVQSLQNAAKGLSDIDTDKEMTDEELAEQMEKIDEAEAGSDLLQQRSVENLAILCGAEWVPDDPDDPDTTEGHYVGGSPTLEDLQSLPFRHLNAFTQWLIGEIRPKKDRPAGKR
jgi:hypothetical protein